MVAGQGDLMGPDSQQQFLACWRVKWARNLYDQCKITKPRTKAKRDLHTFRSPFIFLECRGLLSCTWRVVAYCALRYVPRSVLAQIFERLRCRRRQLHLSSKPLLLTKKLPRFANTWLIHLFLWPMATFSCIRLVAARSALF